MTRFKQLFEIKGYSLFVWCMVLVGLGISVTMPYLSLYLTEDRNTSTGIVGIFLAVSSLSGVFVNSYIAKRSDNGMDRKWIILIAMLSSVLGYSSYVVFENVWVLLAVVTVFNGIGAAAMPQIFAYAQESASASESNDKTFALSTLRSLFSLGFLIGPLGGTIILGAFGYRGLFLGTAAIFLIIASLVFFFLQNKSQGSSPSTKKGVSDRASLKQKHLLYPFLAFIVLFAINTINGMNTPLFMVNELHSTHTEVGIVVSLCAGLEIPIMLVLGAMSQKISNHTLMIAGCFIGILYYVILSLSTATWHVIAAQLLQAIFVAIVMGNGLSYFSDLIPDSPGVSATIYSNGSTLGRLVGSLGGGFLAQFIGFRYVNGVCFALLILTFFILWKSRPSVTLNN